MKNLIYIILMLTAFNAISSEDWEGGQTGNGGNGCWIERKDKVSGWKTIEEIKYWRQFYQEEKRYNARGEEDRDLKLRITAAQLYHTVNLLEIEAAKRALKRFEKIKHQFPFVYNAFIAYSQLLEDVTVAQFEIKGIYEGDISQFMFNCHRFSPAMMTHYNGAVTVFRPVWNELTPFTAEVVLVHEIIRFSQMLSPLFQDMTNNELQRLTAFLFSGKAESQNVSYILWRFEKRLSTE